MSVRIPPVRTSLARLAGAALAVSLLAAGCTGSEEEPSPTDAADPTTSAAASDGGGEPGAGASDGGGLGSDGQSVAAVPEESYSATPAPDGFEPPSPCTGEGAHLAEVGKGAEPALPERAGETLSIEATGIEGEKAQLSATIGDGEAQDVEALAIGETVTIDLWTLSVTSVCEDTQQVEFDLID